MADDGVTFEVKFANGETVQCESQWAAHHEIARRIAFDADPLNPRNVLPADIAKSGAQLFGGRVYVETIYKASELTTA